MRRIDETVKTPEIRYIPTKWDESQMTEIVIKPATGLSTQTIIMRMRDKYQFKVGTSLTLQQLRFEMLDTIVYYDQSSNKADY